MSIAIQVDDELYEQAKRSANSEEMRSISQQIMLWAKVGRAALDNPDLPIDFIKESLIGLSESKHEAVPFVPRSRAL